MAETNSDACQKDLYNLIGYKSIYQSKIANKEKGSGLGIYIDEKFEFCSRDELNQCTANLESLFITLTNTIKPLTIGVIYRPPNGCLKSFYTEFENLLENLPKLNVLISGDFNIDLHTPNNDFESLFFGNGFIPTISVVTHEFLGVMGHASTIFFLIQLKVLNNQVLYWEGFHITYQYFVC